MNPPVEALLTVAALAFVAAMAWTPLWAKFLYGHRLGKHIRDDGSTPVFTALHGHKAGTPTMGGVLIWGTVAAVALGLHALALWLPDSAFASLDFLTRRQTWLPLAALVAAGLVGMVDDWMNVRGRGASSGGLTVKQRLLLYAAIAAVGAWWFYVKLGWDFLHIPFYGDVFVGGWYVPIFILVIVSVAFSVNETDGLDGLAGGTLLMAIASLGAIAFAQGRFQLAALCCALVGALLAFLWFNIPPARFFMGDTGAMSLGVAVGIIAMLTNTALLLPVICFVFLVETLSVIVQVLSKKLRNGRKVFRSAPLHHHLEASGWPEAKIVMRLWVIGGVMGVVGVIVALLDRGLT